MSILADKKTNVIVQGITGKEGARTAKEMMAYGTKVVAGITPGKGGMKTDDGVPVFDTFREVVERFPEANASFVAVPAAFALDAVLEALRSGMKLINVLTEKIPVRDSAEMIAYARREGARLVGPSSVGIISPGKTKIGSVGGGHAKRIFAPGPVGVISKSGGMTAEISRILTVSGIGESTALGIGGDMLVGSDFLDIAIEFEKDQATKCLVIFGEVGGVYEEKLADAMLKKEVRKPVVALIAGRFTEKLPQDTVLGHAGAIVSRGRGSALSKVRALERAGAHLAEIPEDIPRLVKKLLKRR